MKSYVICSRLTSVILSTCVLTSGLAAVPAYSQAASPSPVPAAVLRGASEYRQCYYCHSLTANLHLTGPSLAGLWGKKAGQVVGFSTYSAALKKSSIVWDEATIKKWLANPESMVPGTTMILRERRDQESIDSLVEFLKIAMGQGGIDEVTKLKLLSPETAQGQLPKNLKNVGDDQRVAQITHCGNKYSIVMADGKKSDHWEYNIHLMVDSGETGPPMGKPARINTGSMGDRFAIVFREPSEIAKIVKRCPGK